jgi:hypothetical protein
MTDACKREDWSTIALVMKKYAIVNGLYSTGPVIFTYAPHTESEELYDFEVYMPISASFEPKDEEISFIPELKFDDALLFRLADLGDENIQETYILLDACAEGLNCKLKRPFYHVAMSLYGEPMMDVFAEIEENNDDKQ